MLTMDEMKAIAAALKKLTTEPPMVMSHGTTFEEVEAFARIDGTSRYTSKYAPDEKHPKGRACESARATVDGVWFDLNHWRDLREGEPVESDFRSQAERDAERQRAEEQKRAAVVMPTRPVFCGESRWAWVEVD